MRFIKYLLLLAMLMPFRAHAIDPIPDAGGVSLATDAAIAGLIAAQTITLENIYNERKTRQNAILAAETLVHTSMEKVHKVEDKALEYLSNASAAMQNLYQIKRAATLCVDISNNLNELVKSIPDHIQGTIYATIVSSAKKDIYDEMVALTPYMTQLVTSGSFNVNTYDENGKIVQTEHKVNLLSAADRFNVANTIVTRLSTLNAKIWRLAWEIKSLTLKDMLYHLDPKAYMKLMEGQIIANSLKNEWSAHR